jgi:hypothetical protein
MRVRNLQCHVEQLNTSGTVLRSWIVLCITSLFLTRVWLFKQSTRDLAAEGVVLVGLPRRLH